MRYKITIEYDGTNLFGWQKQDEGVSVQYFLEEALTGFTHRKIDVFGAGRTDAGVHALGQVAHFDLETSMDLFHLREAFNARLRILGAPVSVIEVEEASPDFHARFSAVGRGYVYRILNRRAPTVLLTNRVWTVGYPLDVEKCERGQNIFWDIMILHRFAAPGARLFLPLRRWTDWISQLMAMK